MRKKIVIIGSGYVGAITGIGLANLGHAVEVVDVDEEKIEKWKKKNYPIFEQGIDFYFQKATENGLKFLTQVSKGADFYFIAVGTPKCTDSDKADLKFVNEASDMITKVAGSNSIVVMKSTVPIGTNSNIKKKLTSKNMTIPLVSNPEFLREGSAFSDFFEPDRIVLGSDNKEAIEKVAMLYAPLNNNNKLRQAIPVVKTTFEAAELIKHASNGFLAVKLSYVNEIAQLCSNCGADYTDVLYGMGYDPRIGHNFMQSGPGWGGSCFPKDSRELCATASDFGVEQRVLSAAIEANSTRKNWCAETAIRVFKNFNVSRVGVLGLAFKANTDDVRESPAFEIVDKLSREGFKLVVTDEKAIDNFQKASSVCVEASELQDLLANVDGVVIVTEWAKYAAIDWTQLLNKKTIKCVVDLRSITSEHDHPNIYRY